jgi:acetate kinase
VAAVTDFVLAINSGSSSLKFGLFAETNGDETPFLQGEAEEIGGTDSRLWLKDAQNHTLMNEGLPLATQSLALDEAVKALRRFTPNARLAAVGHRIVHGGPLLREHQRVTAELIHKLQSALHFAPVHIPASIALIQATETLLPEVPQYACFDTVFHRTMPETSTRFALSDEMYKKGIHRFGFHGLSYESVLHQIGTDLPSRVVCAHLGSGASLVALRHGRSIDTSMGLTPTGGIPMATRSGDLDPGVLLFLMRTEQKNADALETLLNHKAGLKALSGGETDMRQLQTRAEQGDSKAALAIDIFISSVRKYIGAYAAELGGLDLLIFTGGIGEHSQYVRERICDGLDFLGIRPEASGRYSKVKIVPSQEEAQIARLCRRLLRSDAG